MDNNEQEFKRTVAALDLANHRRAALLRVAHQLDTWASESRTGGWSTHQAQPMRELASEIRHAVETGDYSRLRAAQS